MNEKYKITTTMEREDYRNFLYLITFKRNTSVWLLILFLTIILSISISLITGGIKPLNLLIIAFFMFLVILSALCLRLESKVKKKYGKSNAKLLKKDQTLSLSEQGIEATNRSKEGTTSSSYENIYEIWETKDYFFFYFTKDLCSLIRKKDIPKEQYDEIISFLKEKLKSRFK